MTPQEQLTHQEVSHQDVFLTFGFDSSEDGDDEMSLSVNNQYPSAHEFFSEEDKFSDILSASQVGTIMHDTGFCESDYLASVSVNAKICDPDYLPSLSGSTKLSDYFSDEGQSSDSLVLSCEMHSVNFDNIDDFEEHQLSRHTINGYIACGICSKTYSTKYLRRNHVKGEHLGEKYECSVQNCGKKFPQKHYRDEHEHTHTAQSNPTGLCYVCDICEHMSDSLEKLKQHKLNHSSVKKYKCRICKIRGYSRSNDRKDHEETCGIKFQMQVIKGEAVPLKNPEVVQKKKSTKSVQKKLFQDSSKK